MNDDQFIELFRYMQESFEDIEQKIASMASQESVDRLILKADSLVELDVLH